LIFAAQDDRVYRLNGYTPEAVSTEAGVERRYGLSGEWQEKLKGCDLAAVTFVRDYVQLRFDGDCLSPRLNCFIWPRVTLCETTASSDMPRYRDILCAQIGKIVGGVTVEPDVIFRIFFEDGSMIEVSLLPDDRPGPEALELQAGKGGWGVW
jgi:hypothetical protein